MRHRTLGEVIQETARGCKRKSMSQLADELGKDDSMFYRMCNANDEGARFPAELLIPLMLATKDFSILEHVASRTGCVAIRIEKLRVPKANGNDIQNDLHETFLESAKTLAAFFRDPSPANRDATVAAIDRHLGEVVAARKKVTVWMQPELEF